MGTICQQAHADKMKKRSEWKKWLGKRYVALPHAVLINARYRALSSTAKALLTDMLLQLNGFNNGDLSAAQTVLAPYGWKDSTRKRALKELATEGLLMCSRVGGKHRCALYAVTWLPVGECNSKLDVSPTLKPLTDFNGENKGIIS